MRHKRGRIDHTKLDNAKKIGEARTKTATLNRAVVGLEAEVDAVLRRAGGKTRLKKVFR